jgi:hypothetical protein
LIEPALVLLRSFIRASSSSECPEPTDLFLRRLLFTAQDRPDVLTLLLELVGFGLGLDILRVE